MKKSIKLLSIILSVVVISALLVSLVACNKDKYETQTVENAEDIWTYIEETASNTSHVENFGLKYTSVDYNYDVSIMAVSNSSVLLGTIDGEKVFIGDLYLSRSKNKMNNDPGIYLYDEKNGWYKDTEAEFSKASTSIQEVGCYKLTNILLGLISNHDGITVSMSKTLKNGNLDSFTIKITNSEEGAYIDLSTCDYDGKQVVKEAKLVSKDVQETYEYKYNVSFEIPEI